MLKCLFILVVCLIPQIALAQSVAHADQIESMLTNEYPEREPGSAVLIAKSGEIVLHNAYGQANIELDVPMDRQMVFEIGSITKQFTAMAILMLMEQGKLKLNNPVSKYLVDYPNGDRITIHNLLTHTSGITRTIKQNPWNETVRKKDFEPLEFIDYFKSEPMVSEPGELFAYNNFGYIILGVIIEKVSGRTYEEFIETEIFQRLGMKNSFFGKDYELVQRRAYGYEKDIDTFRNATYESLSQAYSAGGLMSTVHDLYLWNNAIHSNRVVNESSKNLAFTNHELNDGSKINYGYGWFIDDINGSGTYEHAGGVHGFRTNVIYLPKEDVFVATFSNCSCKDPRNISTEIAALLIGRPYTKPSSVFGTDENKLQKWVGKYTFRDGSARNVSLINHQLLWSLPNGQEIKMIAHSDSVFQLERTFTKVEFRQRSGNMIDAIVTQRINQRVGTRVYKSHTEISLPESTLSRYVGTYNLFPDFDLTITRDGSQLFSQGTDQIKFEIYPESKNTFFFKAIDAQIEFIVNEERECISLNITQDGNTYSGKKVE